MRPTTTEPLERADRLWNWLSWWYDRRAGDDAELDAIVTRLEPLLGSDDELLDFGCASGVVSCRVAPRVRRVLGLDTSPGMIARAVARGRSAGLARVEFATTSVFDPSLARESFDVVLALHVLHLLGDPAAAVCRLGELLRPGGRLVSATPAGTLGGFASAMLSLVPRIGLLSHLHQLEEADVRALLERNGFELTEQESLSGPVPIWYAVARKT